MQSKRADVKASHLSTYASTELAAEMPVENKNDQIRAQEAETTLQFFVGATYAAKENHWMQRAPLVKFACDYSGDRTIRLSLAYGCGLFQFFQMNVAKSLRKELQQVITGRLMHLFSDSLDLFLLVRGQISHKSSRVACPLLTGRNVLVRHNDGTRLEHDIVVNHATLQNRTLVADNNQIIHTAGFEDTTGSNRHVVANMGIRGKTRLEFSRSRQGANDGALSNAATETNRNTVTRIGSYDGLVPDRRLIPICDITDYRGGGSNKGIVCLEGFDALKGQLGPVSHKNLTGGRFRLTGE
jgi:hypothetical protein